MLGSFVVIVHGVVAMRGLRCTKYVIPSSSFFVFPRHTNLQINLGRQLMVDATLAVHVLWVHHLGVVVVFEDAH